MLKDEKNIEVKNTAKQTAAMIKQMNHLPSFVQHFKASSYNGEKNAIRQLIQEID